MCGRFFVDARNREIDRLLQMLPANEPPVKTGEIHPTENALALISGGRAASLTWGFPSWNNKGVIFNARAETALQKPLFANALKNHPAAIPASGFYEWHTPAKDLPRDKYIFTLPDNPVLYLAGFWNSFPREDKPRRFTLLTTQANASISPYHHRMPVLLLPEEVDPWLDGANLAGMLAASPPPLQAGKVS